MGAGWIRNGAAREPPPEPAVDDLLARTIARGHTPVLPGGPLLAPGPSDLEFPVRGMGRRHPATCRVYVSLSVGGLEVPLRGAFGSSTIRRGSSPRYSGTIPGIPDDDESY